MHSLSDAATIQLLHYLVSSVYMCRYLHGLLMPEDATRREKCVRVAHPVMKERCDLAIVPCMVVQMAYPAN